MKLLSFTIFFCLCCLINAQDIKRTAIWYFGQNAGIDFNTNPPTPLTNGAMNTVEGCATISDTNGNLLFYTNGEKIWNKNHQIMDNGDGLLGSWDATQSSIIIPQPDNDSLFYVFTTDAVGQPNGLRYSIVNLNLDNGLGSVVTKNILLQTPVCEKLTATHHENGRDIWVLSHGFGTDKFFTYLITRTGIQECPVISNVGSIHSTDFITNAQGSMKFSVDGKWVDVSVFGFPLKHELFKFDKATGRLNFQYTLSNTFLSYAGEFSKTSNFLYITDRNKNLYQYDLSLQNQDSINNKRKIIYTSSGENLRGIQLALDGKLYLDIINSPTLSVVNRPDSLGDSAKFTYASQGLSSKRTEYALPNFITSYFHSPTVDFTYQTNCTNNTVQFTEKSTAPATSRKWKVIKENILIDSSTLSGPSFTFSDTGTYKVQLIINTADTVTKEVLIEPPLIAKRDTTICNQSNYTMVIPDNYRCIMWLEGQDTNLYTVYNTGIYVVSAYNTKGCYITDTAKVTFSYIGKPNIRKSNDTLYTDSSENTYQWYFNSNPINNSNSQSIKITQNGIYKLTITNSLGCSNTSENFNVSGLSIAGIDQVPFSIYPSPSHGAFTIKAQQGMVYSVSIVNALGQEVYHQNTVAEQQLTISLNRAGFYLIKITDDLGNTYLNKQIIHN